MSAKSASPLEELAQRGDHDFPNLFAARKRTAEGLEAKRTELLGIDHDPEVSVVLVGSWGRAELTSGSDDDFIILVGEPERDPIKPSLDQISEVFGRAPGADGPLGEVAVGAKLVKEIGLDQDDNENLTQRMLLILESVAASNDDVRVTVRGQILDRYLDESIKPFHPPRFFLNDVVRYWRTVCVDFAAKEHKGREKWGLRNAKLRISRKMLFASGLLPILECGDLDMGAIRPFLDERLALLPTDRVAASFLQHDAIDAGIRTLAAFDEFLGKLDDEAVREELASIEDRDAARNSTAFGDAMRLAREVESGLLALLFETESLSSVVRETMIF
jgi:hypothetical protein